MKDTFIYFSPALTASEVMDWCKKSHLTVNHWKFQTKGAVFGAPILFSGNRPTYKHPRRGTEEVHTGIIFHRGEDAIAFKLANKV